MATPNPSTPFEEGAFLPGGHNTDPPLPESSPTTGYKLNHSMLRIRDPKRSLHFYIDLMGMRTVWTMNTGPFTIYYLGYPSTADDRADLRAWSARVSDPRTLTQTLGLLELYHIHGSEKPVADGGIELDTGNTPPHLGFGHLGFTVPDVPAALERLRAGGVPVLKDLGDSSRESVPLSSWEEERGVGVGAIHPNYKRFFDQIAFVADPDGYIVELVPQNMA
ncbi:putative lactoylglutathione lyase [Aspergillus floccosus]